MTQGWVTRDRLREEQEQAKIERARKEGFDDGYLAVRAQASQPVKVLEALESAVEWMTQDGCDCGTDEPGSCGLCLCIAALAELDAAEGGKR